MKIVWSVILMHCFSTFANLTKVQLDSIEFRKLYFEAQNVSKSNPDSAILIFNQISSGCENYDSRFFSYLQALAKSAIGNEYRKLGKTDTAIHWFKESLVIHKDMNNEKDIGRTYNAIGVCYYSLSLHDQALHYYSQSLKQTLISKDSFSLSSTLTNIGLIYHSLKDYETAISNFKKSLSVSQKINDHMGLAETSNNMGVSYMMMSKYNEARKYFEQSKNFFDSLHLNFELSRSLANLGELEYNQGNWEESLKYYLQSLQIKKKINDDYGIASTYYLISLLKKKRGKLEDSRHYGNLSLTYSQEINNLEIQEKSLQVLHAVEKELGNFKKALEMLTLANIFKDSLQSKENQKALYRTEFQYEYEKKALADSLQHQSELLVHQAQVKQKQSQLKSQRIISFLSILGFVSVVVFLIIIYKALQNKRKANIALDQSKKLIETQHSKIIDSISYAQKIQESILPSPDLLNLFNDHMVYYKPKDLVSGDFYWMHQENDVYIIAAADCTGHGVPGAFMSMLGSSLLNEIVIKKEIISPELILNELHRGVIANVQKSKEQSMRDGMDIAIAVIYQNRRQIEFAGALNSMLHISREDLNELRGDLKPIGGLEFKKDTDGRFFSKQTCSYEQGDRIYLFSDGYIDQFGGDKRKKFGKKRFLELVNELQDHPLYEQKSLFESNMQNWKQNYDQIDDQMIIACEL